VPDVQRFIARVDSFQRRNRAAGFVYGVVKKFGDDQGGNLSALITYYGFVSLFPLMLVLVTVLSYVLHNNPSLQHDIVTSAVADFPIVGDQIRHNIGSVQGSGIALVIGILGTLYGGLGIANAAQDAMNKVWEVPMGTRPGFASRLARSLLLIATLGFGILVTTVINGIGGSSLGLGLVGRVGVLVLGVVLNIALFAFAFRFLTVREVSWREVLPGAVIAGLGWVVLQALGGAFVTHTVRGMSATYGLFAIVLGLLAWIFLQARIVVYAAEVNVVRVERLWPRSLAAPTTEADARAEEAYTHSEVRSEPGD